MFTISQITMKLGNFKNISTSALYALFFLLLIVIMVACNQSEEPSDDIIHANETAAFLLSPEAPQPSSTPIVKPTPICPPGASAIPDQGCTVTPIPASLENTPTPEIIIDADCGWQGEAHVWRDDN